MRNIQDPRQNAIPIYKIINNCSAYCHRYSDTVVTRIKPGTRQEAFEYPARNPNDSQNIFISLIFESTGTVCGELKHEHCTRYTEMCLYNRRFWLKNVFIFFLRHDITIHNNNSCNTIPFSLTARAFKTNRRNVYKP